MTRRQHSRLIKRVTMAPRELKRSRYTVLRQSVHNDLKAHNAAKQAARAG